MVLKRYQRAKTGNTQEPKISKQTVSSLDKSIKQIKRLPASDLFYKMLESSALQLFDKKFD